MMGPLTGLQKTKSFVEKEGCQMKTEIVEVMKSPNMTESQWHERVKESLEQIESTGGQIVGASPILEVQTIILGRRFTVEFPEDTKRKDTK